MNIAFDDRWITLKGKKKKNGEDGKGGARIKLDDSGKIIAGLNGKFHGKTIAEMKSSAKSKQQKSIAERLREDKTSEQIKQEAETKADTQKTSAVKFNQDEYNKAVEKIKASNKKLYDRAIVNADEKYNKPIETAKKALDTINAEIKEKGVNVGNLKKIENLKNRDFGDDLKGRLNKARFDLYIAEQNKQASYARAEKKYQLDNDNLVVDGCYSLPEVENKTANNALSNIGHVVKESAKAVMVEVEIDSPYKDHLVVKGIWIPKSILDENGNAPEYFLKKKLRDIKASIPSGYNNDLDLWYYGNKDFKLPESAKVNNFKNTNESIKREVITEPKKPDVMNGEKFKNVDFDKWQTNKKFYPNKYGDYLLYYSNPEQYNLDYEDRQSIGITLTPAEKKEVEQYFSDVESYKEYLNRNNDKIVKENVYLNIPYEQKEYGKAHGAKWDRERKQWYLPKGAEMHNNLKQFLTQDKRVFMAQDKSARSYDKDGRMHVLKTNISKATVNPYYGYEIPNYEKLGLEPKRIYHLLRHPDELKKAVDTFKNLPLLDEHIPVNAKEPEKEHIVGSTGSDVEFKDGFLQCSLSIWDEQAIAGIESGEQKELSSAYYYDVDMTKGEYQGEQYDGIMRNIIGNHVALVDTGRAGRDVVVADEDPFKTSKGKEKMSKAKLLLKKLLAQDEEITPEKLLDVVGVLVKNGEKETFKSSDIVEDEDEDEDEDEVEKKRAEGEDVEEIGNPDGEDEDLDEDGAEDEDEDEDEDEKRTFTYEDVKKAIEKAVLAERKRNKDAEIAKKDVENIVGDVAMDSAKDIYKFALKQAGVDVSGVHPSAYRAMVKMLQNGNNKTVKMASDKASNLLSKYPQLKNIRKG